MAHSFFLHVTWKTWASAPSIDARLAERLAQALPSLAIAERAAIVELAIMPNHVHAVVELTPRADVARLVQRMKGATARFANRDGWSTVHLRWDRGYDARSVAAGDMESLRRYLDTQPNHHGAPLLARWSGPSRDEQARSVLVSGRPQGSDGPSGPL